LLQLGKELGQAMQVLVTGGAGYIGSHTCRSLARAGYSPVVFDDLSTGHRHNVRWGPLYEGSLLDPVMILRVLETVRPAAVIHFAAKAYVGESMEQPERYWRTNVIGSLNLLEAMVETGTRCLVFSSSCSTYGDVAAVPISEAAPQLPSNVYAETKLTVEKAIHWYGRLRQLRAAILRYFNAAGCDPEGELGEEHDPETHLLPRAIFSALGRIPPLQVYGTDWPTGDGTAVRDYVHVADLAEAHLLALERLLQGEEQIVCNLGTGRGTSVLDVLRAVERASGRPVPWVAAPRRAGDPALLVADASLAGRLLSWVPAHPDIETIAAHAWGWFARREEQGAEV